MTDLKQLSVNELRRLASLYDKDGGGDIRYSDVDWTDAFDEMARRLREQEQRVKNLEATPGIAFTKATQEENDYLREEIKEAESALLSCQAQVGELREALDTIAGGHTSRVPGAPDIMSMESKDIFRGEMWEWSQKVAQEALSHSAGSKIMEVVDEVLEAAIVYSEHWDDIMWDCHTRLLEAVRNLQSAKEKE